MNFPAAGQRLLRLLRPHGPSEGPTPAEAPLRSELFSVDQLAAHAAALAGTHRLATGRAPDRLLPRLDANERVLVATHDLVTAAVRGDRRISPAAEWLLDNFYLVEEQIRTARRHLPRSYGRDLPRLAGGPSVGYPRVYAIALDLIAHGDGRVDAASLNAFVGAYQAVAPLALGELWAVPIVLRLALIENLRRVATRIGATRRDRDAAVDWAARMVAAVEAAPTDLILVMADMARADAPLSGAFLAELTRQLQGQSPHLAFATTWLEHRLADQGLTIEQLVRAEGNAQAADQVSVGNSITSLRFLSSTDWREFVEGHSVVERELRADPAGAYAAMAFATRDRYRHAVERVARRSGKAEVDVARQAIGLARASGAAAGRAGHVGYYLIDRGVSALERLAEMRRSPAMFAAAALRRFPLSIYLGGIVLISAAVLWAAGYSATRAGLGWLPVWLLALPAAVAATQVATAIVNWLVTRFVAPRPLPRLDFRRGIPPEHRTLVVVPTMLTSADGVQNLVEGLEVRYLANAEANLHFGLLTDWLDGPEERSEADDELLRLARAGIAQLNDKYRARRPDIFFLFHRARRWNAADRVWMGYERKRGKLADLNAFLRGTPDRFMAVEGEAAVLAGVRYVITLDTDTQLPRGAA
ncbi:MAG: cyclic beta 1-2 glucan synthetase, partial [Phycisphaerae bacterium]